MTLAILGSYDTPLDLRPKGIGSAIQVLWGVGEMLDATRGLGVDGGERLGGRIQSMSNGSS